MMGPVDPGQQIATLAERMGLELHAGSAGKLVALGELMLRWNEHINLTGARDLGSLIGEQFVDAFALARLTGPARSVVDVGSGGGLPGLVFALLRPDIALTLTEPRAKRRAFLHTAARELGIAARVLPDRVETMPPAAFDLASARAVFPPPEWFVAGSRIVTPEGRVVVFLNDPSDWPPPLAARLDECLYTAGNHRRRAVALRPLPSAA